MPTEEHYRKLERMYHGAPINEVYSPTLTVREGEAEIVVEIHPRFFHAADAVHGSVYFKMLDDAVFFAINSLVDDALVLTASFNLYFLRPVSSGTLRAVGRAIHSTKRAHLGEGELFDGEQRLIARGSGSFIRSRIPLTAELGYA